METQRGEGEKGEKLGEAEAHRWEERGRQEEGNRRACGGGKAGQETGAQHSRQAGGGGEAAGTRGRLGICVRPWPCVWAS